MSANAASIPDYINEALFEEALNEGFKRQDVKVKGLKLKLISEGGENYCSDVYRANVEYTTDGKAIKKIALIVKNTKDMFLDTIPHPMKEVDMYNVMVPKMEEILGEKEYLVTKCFRATKDHKGLYIFQDLVDLGYREGDRLKGLNEEQAHLLLKKIAVFHAASMAAVKKDPSLIDRYGKSMLENGVNHLPLIAALLYGDLDHVIELSKDWNGFEGITAKLQKLRKCYEEKLLATVKSDHIGFKVFNHGDLWVNNIMYKYKNDTCVDVKLIDLQISHYGSPGYDLHYFLTTSLPLDLALTKRYDFLRSYYSTLKSTLERLNYSPIPTWDDLLKELRVTEFLALHITLIVVPLVLLDKDASKGKDIDSLNDADSLKKQRLAMYSSKRVVETSRYIVERMNDLGILD